MKQHELYDICIIGGGASGLIAAIKAADVNPEASIAVLEKMENPGKKVAAAGNGRCNLSNISSPDWENSLAFFSSIGLFTRIDSEGRVYPYSEDGRDVTNVLVKACEKRGVHIICRRIVKSMEFIQDEEGYRFLITTDYNKPKGYRGGEEYPSIFGSKIVLISTGGKSKPKLGTSGDGYKLAQALGHSINPLVPVLTAVETEEDMSDAEVHGVREKVEITLTKQGKEIFRERGEIQFTDYGISGICVFNMSRFLTEKDLSQYEISIDFLPDFSESTIDTVIRDTDGDLGSVVKKPISDMILEKKIIDSPTQAQLKRFTLHPKKLKGWEMAQVTRGGIPKEEIDPNSGQSKLIEGLYFAGEMIDEDYPSGGFNLQYAWTSGLKAGLSMGETVGIGGKRQ